MIIIFLIKKKVFFFTITCRHQTVTKWAVKMNDVAINGETGKGFFVVRRIMLLKQLLKQFYQQLHVEMLTVFFFFAQPKMEKVNFKMNAKLVKQSRKSTTAHKALLVFKISIDNLLSTRYCLMLAKHIVVTNFVHVVDLLKI